MDILLLRFTKGESRPYLSLIGTAVKTYHFIITVKGNSKTTGEITATLNGTYTLTPGDTRESAFEKIADRTRRALGMSEAVILLFSLEPNKL